MSLSNVTVPGNVSVSTVPQCAITCTISTIPTSDCAAYGISNFTCLCTSVSFQSQFLKCQETTCTPVEFTAAETFGQATCAAVGHPITLPANATSSAAPVSTVSPATSTAAGSVAPAAVPTSTTTKSSGNKLELKKNGLAVVVGLLILSGVGLVL